MAIKRGVSLYSYQQEQFFGQMDWKAQIREVHDNLKTDGIEIINESVIPQYPFPSEQFIADWNDYMARYNMKAVTMDVYLDTMRFRDHVMNHREAAELLKMDIKLAAAMGFENIRCLCMIPIDIIDMALDTAVKYNVRVGKEIHAPYPIKRDPNREGGIMVTELLEYVDKKGTNMVGLVPDFGIFQHTQSRVAMENTKRHTDPKVLKWVEDNAPKYSYEELQAKYQAEFHLDGMAAAFGLRGLVGKMRQAAEPEDLKEIIPYILSFHGKFNEMTAIPGEPGNSEDAAFDYAGPFKVLNECGFDGYVDSEYEGQRHQQDQGIAGLPDSVKEVRRHHEMMARLSGEGENVVQNLY